MTDNSRKVFEFLKANHGINVTAQEIAKELNITVNAVTGSVNGLVKKDRAVRTEETKNDAEGKAVTFKYISLTDAGMAYDPDAEEAAKQAEKEAAKAAKAAAKAAKAE